MSELTIIGLGPGDPDLLTLAAYNALKKAENLILRTERHGVADMLKKECISFVSLDRLYDEADDFDEIEEICAGAVRAALKKGDVTYAVPGQGILSDGTVQKLLHSRVRIHVIPGLSSSDLGLAKAGKKASAASDGLAQIPAALIEAQLLNPRLPLMVTELDDPYQAGQAKLALQSVYGDEASGVYISSSGAKTLPLSELDRQKNMDHLCLYFLPGRSPEARMDFQDLISIMETLRQKCPWDRRQNHESLRRYLLEESYEAVDAIDRDDPEDLAEELGDVLYQIAFHSVIASAQGDFDALDVTDGICRKMISRHPAIFSGEGDPADDDKNWEANKSLVLGKKSEDSPAFHVAKALPALMRAQKLSKFLQESSTILPDMNEEETGDWLFAVAYTLSKRGIDAESVLRDACERRQK